MSVVFADWYSKLTVAVRWKGYLSYQFCVTSGVRQGTSLSPSIFSVYMIWYDMIWYDMIWYDMIWYDMMDYINVRPKAEEKPA